ncbi:hypothetical protein PMALA_040790 [Plasmodium malariae]|uniref:Uncharacterized protein n=1 Tax=Plasmodium malariae TaxID=5858 RepID=A0A1A8WLE8_PLAMA|nr:hypothetical protein PMALA_040790 [Plasmodium malariae]
MEKKGIHNKALSECYTNRRKLYTRYYRLLTKYKQDKASSIVFLKEELPYEVNHKQDMSNNERGYTIKKKQSSECSLRKQRGHKNNVKNKSCMFETK